MRLRFSLRTLCTLITLGVLFCGWRMQPGRTASAFQAALFHGDVARARELVDLSNLQPSDRTEFEALFSSAEAIVVVQDVWSWLTGNCWGIIVLTDLSTGGTFNFVAEPSRIVVTDRQPAY